jgi:hypothetical protein
VQVISSDAERPRFPLQISALVGAAPPTVGLEPETGIDFSRFPVNEPQTATVSLTNYSPDPVTVSIVGQPPAFLQASLSTLKLEPRQSLDLLVETRNEPPLGKFAGAVTLTLEGTQSTRLTIPISGVSMMK